MKKVFIAIVFLLSSFLSVGQLLKTGDLVAKKSVTIGNATPSAAYKLNVIGTAKISDSLDVSKLSGTGNFYINRNGKFLLKYDSTKNNLSFGYGAMDANMGVTNIAIGKGAMSLTSGTSAHKINNIAIGDSSLAYLTGAINKGRDNVAIGISALKKNTNGANNIGLGSGSLSYNTTGNHNTAIGYTALGSGFKSTNNTAIGSSALANVGGIMNVTDIEAGITYEIVTIGTTDFTLIGAASNTVGISFTASGIGSGTGTVLSTSGSNTSVGFSSASTLGSGLLNTLVGANIILGLSGRYNTVIGAGVVLPSRSYKTIAIGNGNGEVKLQINEFGAVAVNGNYGTTGQVLISNSSTGAATWATLDTNGIIVGNADSSIYTTNGKYTTLSERRINQNGYSTLFDSGQFKILDTASTTTNGLYGGSYLLGKGGLSLMNYDSITTAQIYNDGSKIELGVKDRNNLDTNNVLRIDGSGFNLKNGSVTYNYVDKSSNYTITLNNVVVNYTSSGNTITLPTAAGKTGIQFTIINSSSGANTIATTSSQTIGNFSTATTYSLVSDKAITVVSDGSNWKIKSNF